ncbi:MAG TPA: N-acetyltransferase [Clostridiales bacterium]|nr:N-acetyltransferase [Clostridiales bacterium]
MKNSPFEIVRAQAEDATALLEYLKIIGTETDNLSFGPEGVPLDEQAERSYLAMQAESHDHIQLLAKVNGEIIGTASLNRKPNRMHHRAEFGISLKKAWWGCGAATDLAQGVLAFAREAGIEQVNLEVRSDNKRAIALYEKLGFRKLCTFPGFFKINGELIDFDFMNLDFCPLAQRDSENRTHRDL